MRFIKSFRKTAAFEQHNDGSQWDQSKIDPPEYQPNMQNAAGKAQSGIPDYQPKGDFNSTFTGKKETKKEELKAAARQIFLGKFAAKSDIASTIATQLKWTTTTPKSSPEEQGYDPESKEFQSRYERAKKNAR